MNQEKNDRPGPGIPRIRVTKDGPYLVNGGVPVSEQIICHDDDGQPHGWKEGRTCDTPDSYALCRCGESEQKPYCDGTHALVAFDGTETAPDTPYADQAAEYEGPALKLTDAESYCAGAGFCRRAGGTWKLTRDSGDPRARQTAIEEAGECPSGRLIACETDGRPIEPDFEPSIGLVEDDRSKKPGPLWVRGGIPVESAGGEKYEVRNRVTLCRCGKSSNKPFCDGSHDH